jgi:hypothetical protein
MLVLIRFLEDRNTDSYCYELQIRPVAPVPGGTVHRSRRQVNPGSNREQVINNIFQVSRKSQIMIM